MSVFTKIQITVCMKLDKMGALSFNAAWISSVMKTGVRLLGAVKFC